MNDPKKIVAMKSNTGVSSKSSGDDDDLISSINKRISQELIIGICGAIGSGVAELDSDLTTQLKDHGYSIENIKISDLIIKLRNDPSLNGCSGFEKYNKYQTAGNDIREKLGHEMLASEAISEIKKKRNKYLEVSDDEDSSETPKNTEKVAFIINQLKHPSEVELLQTVYRQNFYLIGINCTEEERKRNLEELSISSPDIDTLFHRDQKEDEKHGQKVEDTFFLADYFISNKKNSERLRKSIERFIELVHGVNGKTPTDDEKGVYEAFSASLQSACLSRQVGAVIMNENGDIVSSGCNDVPTYGGGLYTAEDGDGDHRCIFKGKKCYNDHHKNILQNQFKEILEEKGITDADSLARKLLNDTKAKTLIEYSRAIHAEMDALIKLARIEGQTTIGNTLYCTTYPCHNCARHIVAAGIERVVYIEPYSKSLAIQLHDDAISHSGETGKVSFEAFEGVSPRRYSKFFQAGKRKEQGIAVNVRPVSAKHIDPQYLDSYGEYEDHVIDVSNKKTNPFIEPEG